jgi:hypothetical protein
MAQNRITRGGASRRALLIACCCALLAALLAACGGGGKPTTSVPDREADAKTLNELLSRQLGAVRAYEAVLPRLRGPDLAMAREFRGQEQAHADATLKALRGLGAEAEAEAEPIDVSAGRGRAGALTFLGELESASVSLEMKEIGKLTGSWPRVLVATMAANQAQRLVLIRRALGAKPLQTIPTPFESGVTTAP